MCLHERHLPRKFRLWPAHGLAVTRAFFRAIRVRQVVTWEEFGVVADTYARQALLSQLCDEGTAPAYDDAAALLREQKLELNDGCVVQRVHDRVKECWWIHSW